MMDEDYKLSSEFSGHDGDARAIAAVSLALEVIVVKMKNFGQALYQEVEIAC